MARPRNVDTDNPGAYLGKVTRVTGRTCYVEVRSLAPGLEYGPARYPAGYAPNAVTGENTDNTVAGHVHPFRELKAGDAVAVAFLAAQPDNVVVLAVLA